MICKFRRVLCKFRYSLSIFRSSFYNFRFVICKLRSTLCKFGFSTNNISHNNSVIVVTNCVCFQVFEVPILVLAGVNNIAMSHTLQSLLKQPGLNRTSVFVAYSTMFGDDYRAFIELFGFKRIEIKPISKYVGESSSSTAGCNFALSKVLHYVEAKVNEVTRDMVPDISPFRFLITILSSFSSVCLGKI